NFAPRSRRRKKGSVVGRNEKRICPQDRSTDHAQLRSPQYRRRRRGPFTQARGRVVGRPEEVVGRGGSPNRPRAIGSIAPTILRLRRAQVASKLMHENTEFSLSRDVEAIEIPSGRKLTLEKGTQGVVTQTLGGSYTIATPYGLSRIAERDLDALGLEKPKTEAKEKP